ncbi:MAG: hydrogenase maturation protease [Bacteroidales bacterium]
MMQATPKILVYGYGNPGRQDDGLGVLLAEKIEKWARNNHFTNIITDSNYQLNIEDAAEISNSDVVVFADASMEDIPGHCMTEVEPSPKVEFTMHSVSPGFVVNLCRQIYGKVPACYLMHIRGYEWELKESLTRKAKINLEAAFEFLTSYLKCPERLAETVNE